MLEFAHMRKGMSVGIPPADSLKANWTNSRVFFAVAINASEKGIQVLPLVFIDDWPNVRDSIEIFFCWKMWAESVIEESVYDKLLIIIEGWLKVGLAMLLKIKLMAWWCRLMSLSRLRVEKDSLFRGDSGLNEEKTNRYEKIEVVRERVWRRLLI
jgi:hypothetical protein